MRIEVGVDVNYGNVTRGRKAKSTTCYASRHGSAQVSEQAQET